MFLLVGLGNTGKKYEDTRHNVGFKIIDHLVKTNSLDKVSVSNKFRSIIYKGKILDNTVILCKPTTMMNCSGEAVRLVKEFYKINNEDIFIFHDELDLVLPKVKFKYSGGSAGHNGIKSIDKNISNKYFRIRIGINIPNNNLSADKFVLAQFNKHEKKEIHTKINIIEKNINYIFSKDIDSFMSSISN
jgi:PTH1 family peptidyl-tRNA hydrolase